MGTTHGAWLCPSQREAARRPSFLVSPFIHWALHLPHTLVCVCFQGRVTLSCCRLSTLGEHFPLCRPSVSGSEEVPGACTPLGCTCCCRPQAEAEGSHLTHWRAGGDARPLVARAPGPGRRAGEAVSARDACAAPCRGPPEGTVRSRLVLACWRSVAEGSCGGQVLAAGRPAGQGLGSSCFWNGCGPVRLAGAGVQPEVCAWGCWRPSSHLWPESLVQPGEHRRSFVPVTVEVLACVRVLGGGVLLNRVPRRS